MGRAVRKVAFSSSGDFAYIKSPWGFKPQYQIIKEEIKVSLTSCRYIHDERPQTIDGSFYEVCVKDGQTVQLTLNKLSTRGSPAYLEACLPNLTHFSSLYVNACEVFLLLGRTDEDDIHVLIVPSNDYAPELKTIPSSWADARAMLDEKWEYEWGYLKRSSPDRESDDLSHCETDRGSESESEEGSEGSVQGSDQGSHQEPDQETDDVHI